MELTVDAPRQVRPLYGAPRGLWAQIGTYVFIVGPFLALLAAVPLTWGWGLGWLDLALAACFYTATCLGVTVGFHRYFTHRAFKAVRPLRVGLAIAGSMALQGPITHWHRPCSAGCSPGPGGVRSPRSSGPGSCGFRSCTT
jgi:stearoyl-CoA desaturase (delta-9 desaturase)